jgi:hypothetical protein
LASRAVTVTWDVVTPSAGTDVGDAVTVRLVGRGMKVRVTGRVIEHVPVPGTGPV